MHFSESNAFSVSIHPGSQLPTEKELISLARVLWDWPLCDQLGGEFRPSSRAEGCSDTQRITQFKTFMAHYKLLVMSYNPLSESPVLRSHSDLCSLIAHMKENCNLKKSQLARGFFLQELPESSGPVEIPSEDEECAMNLALTVMVMINCIAQGTSAILLEEGSNRIPWRWEVTPSEYVALVLPRKHTLPPRYGEEPLFLDTNSPVLMARELKRLAGMKFRATNDITNHLRYDPINNVLSIFHHTAFIKEQLRLSRNRRCCSYTGEFLESGALPRQYLLECLYTLQKILFPLWDSKSVALLRSLVSDSAFDPDVLDSQDVSFIADDEEKISFTYLGGRLAELYEELQNPQPRGWLASWLERRSGARYVMLATVAGVVFAVVLGMAGFAISVYQTWISYQAWKAPVPSSSS